MSSRQNFFFILIVILLVSTVVTNCQSEENKNPADHTENEDSLVVDIDGNEYATIQIGDQLWMAENLRVTHYRNGDPIPNLTNAGEWSGTTEGAYCVYENDTTNAEPYGNLYNWYAVNDARGIAPEGWHIPSDEEIIELEMVLGLSEEDVQNFQYRGDGEGSQLAGSRELWTDGDLINHQAFGQVGFNASPCGGRDTRGIFYNFANNFYLWNSTENDDVHGGQRDLVYNNSGIGRWGSRKGNGYSVRCIKD